MIIKYNSKSTLRWLDHWNQQCFTHLRLIFSRWKVELITSSEKNCVFEKHFQILAKNAIETFSQSNLLIFYWGARTAKFSASVSLNQAIGLLNRKWRFYSAWKSSSTFEVQFQPNANRLSKYRTKKTFVVHEKSIRKRTRENSQWDKVTNLHTVAPPNCRWMPLLPQETQRGIQRERERERERDTRMKNWIQVFLLKIHQGNQKCE